MGLCVKDTPWDTPSERTFSAEKVCALGGAGSRQLCEEGTPSEHTFSAKKMRVLGGAGCRQLCEEGTSRCIPCLLRAQLTRRK
eukprot:1144594-Pelagomonas_calceolata.AAC.2